MAKNKRRVSLAAAGARAVFALTPIALTTFILCRVRSGQGSLVELTVIGGVIAVLLSSLGLGCIVMMRRLGKRSLPPRRAPPS